LKGLWRGYESLHPNSLPYSEDLVRCIEYLLFFPLFLYSSSFVFSSTPKKGKEGKKREKKREKDSLLFFPLSVLDLKPNPYLNHPSHPQCYDKHNPLLKSLTHFLETLLRVLNVPPALSFPSSTLRHPHNEPHRYHNPVPLSNTHQHPTPRF
jgi:hypothetical protein